jgi:hypothetical protein
MLRLKETAMQVEVFGEVCELIVTHYARPRNVCLRLVDADGLPMATASVNPDYLLEEGTVAIKDYSENEGILAALVAAGVVEPTGETIPIGYAEAHLCRLLVK